MVAEVDVLHRVKAEAVHAEIEPVFRDLHDLLAHGGVVEVQLRHPGVEVAFVIIVRAVDRIEGPPRGDIVPSGAPAVKIIELVGGVPVLMRVLESDEPGVERAAVVDRQIQDQLDVALMALLAQLAQIVLRAEVAVDLIVVHRVVFVIARGLEDRREPDALDAETFARIGIAVVEIVQALDDPAQIADLVAVGVGEGADEDLIKHAVVVRAHEIGAQRRIAHDVFAPRALPGRSLRGGSVLDGRFGGRSGAFPAAGEQRADEQEAQ